MVIVVTKFQLVVHYIHVVDCVDHVDVKLQHDIRVMHLRFSKSMYGIDYYLLEGDFGGSQ
jgi:hypothetical protein